MIADDVFVPPLTPAPFSTRRVTVRRRLTVAVALALACGAGAVPWARAQNDVAAVKLPKIEVESQSSVTVVGASESLRAVISALCESSGVELKSYRAPDRPMSARYEDVPLRHVFERLLRQESFVLGFMAPGDGGEPEVAWLSVIGTEGHGSTAAAGSPAAGGVSPSRAGSIFPMASIDNQNAGARVAAAKLYARRLDSEEELRQQLIDGSLPELALQLSGHRFARAFLQTVRTTVRNPQARVKINSLLSRVR